MPAHPLNPHHPRWADVVRAAEMVAEGKTQEETALQFRIPRPTLQNWLKAYERANLPAGIQDALTQTGVSADHAKFGYRRVQDDDGNFNTVFWRMPESEAQDFLEAVRSAFEGMQPAAPVRPPDDVVTDLCSVYPIVDIHANMIARAASTGGSDYNLELMQSDLLCSVQKVMARTPDSHTATLLLNGDTLDTDNEAGTTPRSGHIMHKDGGQFAATAAVIEVIRVIIPLLLLKHQELVIRVLRGNHDESSHIGLTFGLSGYMSQEERVEVESIERDLFMRQWGDCAIFAHHGDIPKPWERFALALSDVCPFWSATHHRTCFFGHGHNSNRQDFGAINVEMLRPFAPLSRHAAGLGYVERRALHSITFDKRDGIVGRGSDPVRRE